MHDAAILDHSPQPGFLKAELLLDNPKRMLSFGADMRYGKQKPFRLWQFRPDHADGPPARLTALGVSRVASGPTEVATLGRLLRGSLATTKTSGTGLASPSSVRTLTATPIAMVYRSWPSYGPWLSTCCAGTFSDRSALA